MRATHRGAFGANVMDDPWSGAKYTVGIGCSEEGTKHRVIKPQPRDEISPHWRPRLGYTPMLIDTEEGVMRYRPIESLLYRTPAAAFADQQRIRELYTQRLQEKQDDYTWIVGSFAAVGMIIVLVLL